MNTYKDTVRQNEILDLVSSIRNRCELVRLAIDSELIYTLIKDIYKDAQELIGFCKVGDAEGEG